MIDSNTEISSSRRAASDKEEVGRSYRKTVKEAEERNPNATYIDRTTFYNSMKARDEALKKLLEEQIKLDQHALAMLTEKHEQKRLASIEQAKADIRKRADEMREQKYHPHHAPQPEPNPVGVFGRVTNPIRSRVTNPIRSIVSRFRPVRSTEGA